MDRNTDRNTDPNLDHDLDFGDGGDWLVHLSSRHVSLTNPEIGRAGGGHEHEFWTERPVDEVVEHYRSETGLEPDNEGDALVFARTSRRDGFKLVELIVVTPIEGPTGTRRTDLPASAQTIVWISRTNTVRSEVAE